MEFPHQRRNGKQSRIGHRATAINRHDIRGEPACRMHKACSKEIFRQPRRRNGGFCRQNLQHGFGNAGAGFAGRPP